MKLQAHHRSPANEHSPNGKCHANHIQAASQAFMADVVAMLTLKAMPSITLNARRMSAK